MLRSFPLPAAILLLAAAAFPARTALAVETAFEHDTSLPLVYLNVAVKAGSVNDPDGQSGITNFMAEMLLRGSKSRTKEQIDLELDQMGAKLDVEARAEAVIMRGAVLASQLDRYLALVTDLITQPSFPEHEIRKLKSEVVSDILEELGHDPSLAGRRATKFMFHGHPYGKAVLGTVKEVEGFTPEQIAAQYDRLFRDKKLLIVGSGDAPEEKIRGWAAALAAARPDGEEPVKVAAPEDAPYRRLQIIDKPDRTQTQIYLGQIGLRMTDPRFFPLYLANHAFGGGSFSARLMVEIRVKRGWSYGAGSHFRQGRQPRSWQIHLFPASKDTAAALAYTVQMVEDYKNKGVTAAEFEFAQRSLVNSSGFMYNTPQKRVENKLLERTLDLPDGFMKTYGPELEKVTLEQANAAVKDFVKPDRLSISVLGTAQDLKDSLIKAAAVTPDHVEVVPYTQE